MIEFGEVAVLVLGIAVVGYALMERAKFARLPLWGLLLGSLITLTLSWLCSVLEGVLWAESFQILEHLLTTLACALLAVWSWEVFSGDRGEESP